MSDLQEIKEKLDLLLEAVCGDPTDISSPGMLLRVDRLEHSSKIVRNSLWLIGSTTVIIISNLILKYI